MTKFSFYPADEDYESAVKALNGKLYPDVPQRKTAARGDGTWLLVTVCITHMQFV